MSTPAGMSHSPVPADPAPASASFPGLPGTGDPATHSPLPGREDPASAAVGMDVDRLADLVYDRISDRVGQHTDVTGEMPSVEEAVTLRERAPELYDLWLRIAQDRAATGNYVQRAPYEVPERLAQSGRPRALSALVVVLAFCGYLAWLGGPGPYIAGLIAIVDLIGMLSLFFGLRTDHLTDSRYPARKRLTSRPRITHLGPEAANEPARESPTSYLPCSACWASTRSPGSSLMGQTSESR
jgi:hypothetical protein